MTNHVTQLDVRVACKLLNKRVVVGGEECPTFLLFSELPHHCTCNGCTIIGSSASSWQEGDKEEKREGEEGREEEGGREGERQTDKLTFTYFSWTCSGKFHSLIYSKQAFVFP